MSKNDGEDWRLGLFLRRKVWHANDEGGSSMGVGEGGADGRGE